MAIERWTVAPPEVEEQEAAWWQEFAWIAKEISWVQPPAVRRILRKHYLRKIVAEIPPGGIVVDFGCGDGWLTVLLAEVGARRVVGVDNAPAQLRLARELASEAGVSDRVSFATSLDDVPWESVDAVICHGVLHHMAWTEIDALCGTLKSKLKSGATVLVFEPVEGQRSYSSWSLPLRAIEFINRRRRQSTMEIRTRDALNQRRKGPRYPGHGVSPKEMPFQVGELERRLGLHFRDVEPGRPVLYRAVEVAMEGLLLEMTYPKLGRFALHWLLPLYGMWERASFFFARDELYQGWVFCLSRAKA